MTASSTEDTSDTESSDAAEAMEESLPAQINHDTASSPTAGGHVANPSSDHSNEAGLVGDDSASFGNPSFSLPLDRIETLDTGTPSESGHDSIPQASAGALDLRQHLDSSADNTKAILFASIQRLAEAEALAELKEVGLDQPYSKLHPEVVNLASEKYSYMCRAFSQFGVAPSTNQQGVQLRQIAQQGLEIISANSPSALGPAPASNTINVAGVGSLNHMMQMTAQANDLPPILREHVGHPVLKVSRYADTFHELKLLGQGGFGKVFQVKHKLTEADFAVKKITVNPARIKRIEEKGKVELDLLLTELRTIAKLEHPNIIRFHDGWLEHHSGSSIALAVVDSSRNLALSPTGLPRLLSSPDVTHEGGIADGISQALTRHSGNRLSSMSSRPDTVSGIEIVFEVSSEDRQDSCNGNIDDGNLDDEDLDDEDHEGLDDENLNEISRRLHNHERPLPRIQPAVTSMSTRLVLPPVGRRSVSDISALWSNTDSEAVNPDESCLVLYIQMALHPMTLSDYISLVPTGSCDPAVSHVRHCFHGIPSMRILTELLDGVNYLHMQGLAHRDLKPSNIFLSVYKQPDVMKCVHLSDCAECRQAGHFQKEFLNVRIGDFGLVTEIAHPGAKESAATAASSKVVGTALYRPLNRPSDGGEEKLDIFALGIIALEMLLPFSTKMERHHQISTFKQGNIPDGLAECVGDKLKDVPAVLLEMVSADASKRPTCDEIRKRILEVTNV